MVRSELSHYFNDRRLTEAELGQYETQGYLVIDDTLTPDGVATLERQCMAIWRAEKGEFDPNATWLQNALLTNIHHRSSLVRDFYFRGPLVDIAEQIIGPNVKGATSQLTFKMRGNTKPFGWHQDNGYGQLVPENAITTLTALEDNDEETGCLWLIPGSHHQGQIDVSERLTTAAKVKNEDLSIDVADESAAQPMPLKAGSTLIFHCHMLHKSEGNQARDRDRRVLFLRYADADAVEAYNDNQPRLGRVVRGHSQYAAVQTFELELDG